MVTVKEPTYLYTDDVPIDDFTRFSDGLKRKDDPLDGHNWRELYAQHIDKELVELYGQHGPVELLLNNDTPPQVLEQHPELREWAIDELSDMLWFDTMAADQLGVVPEKLVEYALAQRSIASNRPIASFLDIQQAAIDNAETLKMLDFGARLAGNDIEYSIEQNPAWVYWQQTQDLVHRLEFFEPGSVDLQYSLGSHLLAIGYVSKQCLDFDMHDLARYNSYKLLSRRKFGKSASHLMV